MNLDDDLNAIPQVKRGLVYCHECGRQESIEGKNCFRTGWPKCCGYTMSLDSPEERRDNDPRETGGDLTDGLL